MDHDARDAPESAPPATAGGGQTPRRAGDFERYALIAALTLVVLCLLVWDRWHGDPASEPAPRPDRTLRVRIGGDAPPANDRRDVGRASNDLANRAKAPAPAPAPPAPAPAPERTYTVKDGDTLGAIASRELGSATRAAEIAALNGIQDPAMIRKGAVLKLPAK